MPVAISPAEGGRTMEVTISGKLHHADYERFVPIIERSIAESGKLRALVRMEDFHGWDAAALWDDLKFDVKHFRDIERLALVGDKQWEKGMASFCKPFTTAEVRFFEPFEIEAARAWISEP